MTNSITHDQIGILIGQLNGIKPVDSQPESMASLSAQIAEEKQSFYTVFNIINSEEVDLNQLTVNTIALARKALSFANKLDDLDSGFLLQEKHLLKLEAIISNLEKINTILPGSDILVREQLAKLSRCLFKIHEDVQNSSVSDTKLQRSICTYYFHLSSIMEQAKSAYYIREPSRLEIPQLESTKKSKVKKTKKRSMFRVFRSLSSGSEPRGSTANRHTLRRKTSLEPSQKLHSRSMSLIHNFSMSPRRRKSDPDIQLSDRSAPLTSRF